MDSSATGSDTSKMHKNYLTNPDLTTKSEEDQAIKSVKKSESINPTSIKDARPTTIDQQSNSEDNNEVAGPDAIILENTECYNMNHKNRGICVIFNHETFEMDNIRKRKGTEQDVMRLKKSFTNLEFNVKIYTDFSYTKIMDTIKKLSELDHTDNDCICVIVLSHGLQNDFLLAMDAAYPLDKIWKPFTADKCKTLAGKPKLFFIQACRGNKVDNGFASDTDNIQQDGDCSVTSCVIPTHADFLIAYSTVLGFCSWRDPTEGTWYIQWLCKILDEYGMTGKRDLINMLTLTAQKVAARSIYDKNNKMFYTQMPSVTTMLLKSLYFLPKSGKIGNNFTR